MRRFLAAFALAGLVASPAWAETIVDFTFSGEIMNNGVATGTTGTAAGDFVFNTTGYNVAPAAYTVSVTGIPGFQSSSADFSSIDADEWAIAPNGDLLGGEFASRTDDGQNSRVDFFLFGGSGLSDFDWYSGAGPTVESFSGSAQFTKVESVTEPVSLAVFATGLTGLFLARRRLQRHVMPLNV